MGHTAVMDRSTATASSAKYPSLLINGAAVQLSKDMVLEFTDDNDRMIQVVVAPTPAGNKVPTRFFRTPGGEAQLYDIVPALMLRISGQSSKKAIAVGYSDSLRKLLLLFPAVDVLKNERGHEKLRESPMLYRAVDPLTGKTVKPLSVAHVRMADLSEIDLAE